MYVGCGCAEARAWAGAEARTIASQWVNEWKRHGNIGMCHFVSFKQNTKTERQRRVCGCAEVKSKNREPWSSRRVRRRVTEKENVRNLEVGRKAIKVYIIRWQPHNSIILKCKNLCIIMCKYVVALRFIHVCTFVCSCVCMNFSWMMGVEMILDGVGRTFVDLFIKIEKYFPNANKLMKCTAHLTCQEMESSTNSGRHQNNIKHSRNTRTSTITMLLRVF